MVEYIDIEYYQGTYKGTVPLKNLNKLIIEASSYIKRMTFSRINERNVPKVVKYTTCLIIDKIYEFDSKKEKIGIKKSESVGKVSVSYTDIENIEESLEKEKKYILQTYLCDVVDEKGIPLLYRGV